MTQEPLSTAARDAARQREVRHVTLVGLAVNLALVALKGLAGLVAGSQALLADAIHSLSDSCTDVLILTGAKYWFAPRDRSHPYGHARIETLVSLFIGLSLAAAGIGLGWRALAHIGEATSVRSWLAVAAAALSLSSKEALYRWTIRSGRRLRSNAVVANAWHHRSDALSSLPVLASTLAAFVWRDIPYLDAVAAVLVCAMLLRAAWKIVFNAGKELIDCGCDEEQLVRIKESIDSHAEVKSFHAVRTRQAGGGCFVDVHVQVDGALTVARGHAIASAVEQALLELEGSGIVDVLVHIEPYAYDRLEEAASEMANAPATPSASR